MIGLILTNHDPCIWIPWIFIGMMHHGLGREGTTESLFSAKPMAFNLLAVSILRIAIPSNDCLATAIVTGQKSVRLPPHITVLPMIDW